MYEENAYEAILERMLDRADGKLDKRPSSVIYDTHSAAAIELQNLYIELEYLVRNSYGDSAAREYLVMLAKDRGLSPKPATKALLKGEFDPPEADVLGKRFNIGSMGYTAAERIAPGQYAVRCESPGSAGNAYLGRMVPVDYIDGLRSAELTGLLVPGGDEEDTEAFRQRYFESFNERAFGGNRADYLSKVKGVGGVGGAKVERVWNGDVKPSQMVPDAEVAAWYESAIGGMGAGPAAWLRAVYEAASARKLTAGGSVLVVIVGSNDYGKAPQALVDSVQDMLDPVAGEGEGLAPIGHVVRVRSAEEAEIMVTVDVSFEEGGGWDNLAGAIAEAAGEYLLELRREWEGSRCTVVRVSRIESRILAVRGVADVANTKLNGSPENIVLGAHEIPVLGGVSA